MIQYPTVNVKYYIGIDPGKDGCLSAIDAEGSVRLVQPFGETEYLNALKAFAPDTKIAILEHVGGIPGQSAPAAFNFGDNFGAIRGILLTLGIPYELVRPQKWKRAFSCTSDKNTSIQVAKRLFPGQSLKRTPQCTKDHDGIAESLLMAEYGRRVCDVR